MSNEHWFDGWREKWLPRGPGDAPGGEPDPPPDPPDGDTFAETRAVRLAPGALTDTVATPLPLLFDLTRTILKTAANGGESLQNGLDIRFELSDTTLVPHVLRSYSATTGRITGWLRLPAGQGPDGLEFNLLVGNAVVDPQPFPTGTWSGYSFVNLADGSDDVAGRDLTLQSGVSAGSHFDSIDFDGAGGIAVVADSDFLDGVATETWIVWVDGDASMANTSRGFVVEGNLAEFGQSGRLWRNRPASEDSLFIGAWRTGGWTDWKGPVGSSINGPQTIVANYNSGSPITVMIEGVTVAPVSSTTSTGNLRTWGNDFALGRGSTETAGSQSWLGSVMVQVRVDWPCLEPEALLLARMLYHGDPWQVIQIADDEGAFEALAAPPIVISEEPGGGETETPDELPTPIRTVNVTNASQLTAALADAQAGDEIVLADGSYGGGFTISGKNGTADNPIVIRAENLLDASLGGEVNTCLTISGGSHVWVHGLNFTGYILNGVYFSGQRHKVLRCRFADYGRSTYFTRSHGVTSNERTDFCEIAFCLFESPRALSAWTPADGQWPQWRWGYRGGYQAATASYDLTIRRCHFRNFPNTSDPDYRSDQSEGIEVAATGLFTPTRMTISYCLFENMPWSEGAMIDCKAGDQGLVEYCTFVTSNMRAIDLRQCRQWTVQHNWCENTTGISVYGPDHTLTGNRIVGTGSILLLRGNGDESIYGNARVSNCLVQCNIGPLRIGLDYSSASTSYLPTGVQVNGHSGTVNIQPGSGVTQNSGYACPYNTAFKLTSAEVGPDGVATVPPTTDELFLAPFPGDAFDYRIGDGATYADVPELAAHQGSGTFNGGNNKFGIWTDINEASDPVRTVTGSGIGLPLSNVRMPDGWPPFTTGGEATLLVDFQTRLSHCFVGMTRSEDSTTRAASIQRSANIGEWSHGTTLNFERRGTSASGINNLKTLVRSADLFRVDYEIPYAVGVVLPRGETGHASPAVISKSIQVPAGWVDYNANEADKNTGPLAYGARLGIPPTYDFVTAINARGESAQAKEIAIRFFRQMTIFGCIVVDGGSQPNFRIDTRDLTIEFGLSDAAVTAIYNELTDIIRALLWQNLKLITNAVTGATAVVTAGGGYTGSIGTLTNPVGAGTALDYGDIY